LIEQLERPEPDHYIARADILAGLGGDSCPAPSTGWTRVDGSLGGSTDWAAVAVEVKP
jgi:hypothetical protein